MRNKKIFRYALFLAVLAPFLAFSVSLAEHSEDETLAQTTADKQRALREAEMRRQEDLRKQEELKRRNMDQSDGTEEGDKDRSELQRRNADMVAKRRMAIISISKMMENQVNRAEKALDRLDDIMARIQTRYDKLKAKEGVDLTKVDAALAKARTEKAELASAITDAKDAWTEFKAAQDNESAEAEEVRALGKEFMESMRNVNSHIKSFHKSLLEVVRAMKAAEPKPEARTPLTEDEE